VKIEIPKSTLHKTKVSKNNKATKEPMKRILRGVKFRGVYEPTTELMLGKKYIDRIILQQLFFFEEMQ
jgi:hypothetical protein